MNTVSAKTTLLTSTKHPPSPYLMGGSTRIAQDTLVLTLGLDSSSSKLLPGLDDTKNQLQSTDHQEERLISVGVGDTKMRWNLQRMGTRRYPYVLKSGDITLLLSKRGADSPMPSAELHIGSMSCQLGALKVFENVKGWLNLNRIKVISDQVNRIDLCADVSGYDLNDPIMRIFDPKHYVRRTRDFKKYEKLSLEDGEDFETYQRSDVLTGVMIGGRTAPLKMRMYDKILELNKRENEAKKIFFESLWGGLPQHITRVEFQLRRDVLKEFLDIGCYSDLLNNIPKIWKYLTTEWFRHSVRPIDRKNRNQTRMTTSPFWHMVQSATHEKEPAVRKKTSHVRKPLSMLKAQVKGLMTTIISGEIDQETGEMVQHDEYFQVLKRSTEIVHEVMTSAMESQKSWQKTFLERRLNTILWNDVKEEVNAFDYGCFDKQLELDFAY